MVNQGTPVLPTADPFISVNSVTCLDMHRIISINATSSHFILALICYIVKLHMKVNLSEQLNIAPIELVFSVVTPSCTPEEPTASIFRVEMNAISQIYGKGGDVQTNRNGEQEM